MVFLLGALGCTKSAKPAPAGGSDVPPAKVNLSRGVELCQAERRTLISRVDTVGLIEAEGQTDVAAGVSGLVDEVNFREGDVVDPKDDKPLVLIDQKRYVALLRAAEANAQRMRSELGRMRDQFDRAISAGTAVSDQERKQAELILRSAEAELRAAEANLDLAKQNLERSRVRPPYRGQINSRRVTRGTYLEDKTVIASLADLSRLRLVGYCPETATPMLRELFRTQAERLKAARVALPLGGVLAGSAFTAGADLALWKADDIPSGFDPEFTLQAYPQYTLRARLFFVSTVGDPSTHMFEIKAEVNAGSLPIELRPGFTARIQLPLQNNPDACVVPEEAVRSTERGYVAFEPVAKPGPDGTTWVARVVPVEVGFRAPGYVEVRRGLAPGQWLVRRGADALEDGTPIRFPEAQVKQLTARR